MFPIGRLLPVRDRSLPAYHPHCALCGDRRWVLDTDGYRQRCPTCAQREDRDAQHAYAATLLAVSGLGALVAEDDRLDLPHQRPLAAAVDLAARALRGETPIRLIVLAGRPGVGKTRALATIVRHACAAGHAAVYLSVPTLQFDDAESVARTERQRYLDVPLLALDDVGPDLTRTPARAEWLSALIIGRLAQHRLTIVATNHDASFLPDRLQSRCADKLLARVIVVSGADVRRQPR